MGFVKEEFGGAMVDWMIIMAGCICLCLATLSMVEQGLEEQSESLEAALTGDVIFTQGAFKTTSE